MMSTTKVAVVTGSNKGIGFAIVKGLCEKYKGDVYLTSRDAGRGEKAIKELEAAGLKPKFYQLDITNQGSISKFKEHIANVHGGIDLLVNNAAIAYHQNATEPFSEQAEVTVSVNYFSLLKVCESLFPLLRPHARVVNLSSSAGHLSRIPSTEIKQKFADPKLTIPQLNALMEQFVLDAKAGTNAENGWGNSAYLVSKVGVSCLTILQQRQFDAETPSRNIQVNSVHPGYVDTDMTNHKGTLTIEQGAAAPLFLALEPHEFKGQYIWCNSNVVDWFATTV